MPVVFSTLIQAEKSDLSFFFFFLCYYGFVSGLIGFKVR